MKAPAAMRGMHFVIESSALDCLSCGNCAGICPGDSKLGKALTMVPFNPALIEEGKNPFSLDSKEPNWKNFHDFLLGDVRYLSVKKAYPNVVEELLAEAQRMAQIRYKSYIRKAAENRED